MILPPAPDPPAIPAAEWQLVRTLLPADRLHALDPKAAQALYTPAIGTWLLIDQRLQGNASLHDAVAEFALRFPPAAMPACNRARQRCGSAHSGASRQARSDLERRVLDWAAEHGFSSLVESYPPSCRGRRGFIIDGSTVQRSPTPALRAAFPPACNPYGPSHWPILHLAVAHAVASGLALMPESGPLDGPAAVREIALAKRLLARRPAGSILLADRNFGIFAFADAAVRAGHGVLLRLTRSRFTALVQRARPAGPGSWALTWRPRAWERQADPELPAAAQVTGGLHAVRVDERLILGLFPTEQGSGAELAAWYRHRLHVETDIRDLKATLVLDQLKGKSVAMVAKEWAAAMVAYTLANPVRRLAAARLGIEPRRLSFAGVWSLLKAFLGGLQESQSERPLQEEVERLLRAAGPRKLPRRSKDRRYPREVIPRRRKYPERKRHRPTPVP